MRTLRPFALLTRSRARVAFPLNLSHSQFLLIRRPFAKVADKKDAGGEEQTSDEVEEELKTTFGEYKLTQTQQEVYKQVSFESS
jgi:hypothetical protein